MVVGVGAVTVGFAEEKNKAAAVEGAPLNQLFAGVEHLRSAKSSRIKRA